MQKIDSSSAPRLPDIAGYAAKRPFLSIAVVILLLYLPAIFYGYTYFDDDKLVIAEYAFNSHAGNIFHLLGRPWAPSANGPYSSRPLFNLTIMLDALAGGPRPYLGHAMNIFYYVCAGWLLVVLLSRLGYAVRRSLPLVILLMALPIVAPVAVWITARNESLLALFSLGALYFLIGFLQGGRGIMLFFHLLLFGLGLFVKENAAVICLLAPAYMLLVDRRWAWRKAGLLAAGYICLTLLWVGLRVWGMRITPHHEAPMNSAATMITGLVSALGNVANVFWPSLLTVVRLEWIVAGLVLAGAIGMLYIHNAFRDRGRFWFGLLWFVFFLVPTMLFKFEFIGFMNHRLFVPLFGLLVMALELKLPRPACLGQKGRMLAWLGAFGMASFGSVTYSSHFVNGQRFWKHEETVNPASATAQNNLGLVLMRQGQYPLAEKHLRSSLALNWEWTDPHANLAYLYLLTGRAGQAVNHYRLILKNETNPQDRNLALLNLGVAYAAIDKMPEAVRCFSLVLNSMGWTIETLYNIARQYDEGDHPLLAQQVYRAILLMDPRYAPALINLGIICQQQGRLDEAGRLFRAAVSGDPRNALGHFNYAVLLRQKGDTLNAKGEFDRAVALDPVLKHNLPAGIH